MGGRETRMTFEEFSRLNFPKRIKRWLKEIYAAHLCYDLDPVILAALMDRESLGGDALMPQGAGGTGDDGHGLGLMQIDRRYHETFVNAICAGSNELLWRDPAFNVLYGGQLLRSNLSRSSENYHVAVAGYNAGLSRILGAMANEPNIGLSAELLDQFTTGKNYVSDVFRRAEIFKRTVEARNA